MTDQEKKQILLKIKRYQLLDLFENMDALSEWLDCLNQKQISNFLNLNLERINVNNFQMENR